MHKIFSTQRIRALALIALILMAGSVLVSGCVTTTEVRNIVNDSNNLLMVDQLMTPEPSPDGTAEDWQVTAQKIDTFIAAHPDQEATNGALRVRQAFLYLNNEKYNMAKAAFQDAEKFSSKLNSRDAALMDFRDDIIWWFEHSNTQSFNWDDAKAHLDALKRVLPDDKKKILGVHEYLLEIRTYLALKMTPQVDNEEKNTVFRSGIEEYARIFDSDDITALKSIFSTYQDSQKVSAAKLNFCSGEKCDPNKDSWASIKRRARAVTVLETVAEVVKRSWPNTSGTGYDSANFNPDFSSASAEAQELWSIIFNRAKQKAGIE